ncbi:hypothetical protein BGE01nite_44270 [Brevifollis gellanilyticus]|uniref:Uncharacterized protein n=2 Tax=Brevifollis gellanilyticus TaxID=748831 RepID=A0A512MEJ7_9BACT|nr:hypothetical protein BGE01nite_44270 [Brevifollis gellanilyticus]
MAAEEKRITVSEAEVKTEVAAALVWLDALGYPSVKGLQPGAVKTNGTGLGTSDADADRWLTQAGFLKSGDGGTLDVLNRWLVPARYHLQDDPPDLKRRFEPKDLEWLVMREMDLVRGSGAGGFADMEIPRPPVALRLLLLARYCRELNEAALFSRVEARLLEQVKLSKEAAANAPAEWPAFYRSLEEQASLYMIQLCLHSLTDRAQSWEVMSGRLRAVAEACADRQVEASRRARLLAERMSSYAEEEKSEPLMAMNEIRELPIEKRVNELIRCLRAASRDGSEGVEGVHGELVKLGQQAVPGLIRALADHRPSRTPPLFSCASGPQADLYVSSIADEAATLLRDITGHTFAENQDPKTGIYEPDGAERVIRQDYEMWWADFQAKGEREFLIQQVSLATRDMEAMSRLLLKKYPQDAIAAIATGLPRIKEPYVRSNVIQNLSLQTLGRQDDPRVIGLLRTEMLTGPTLWCRVSAAVSLRNYGQWQPDITEAMLTEWRDLARKKESYEDANAVDSLISYLTFTQDVKVIEALMTDLRSRPIENRLAFIDHVADAYPRNHRNTDLPTSPELRALIEKSLVSLLDDDAVKQGVYGPGFLDVRAGERAAEALVRLLPEEYAFDAKATAKEKAVAMGTIKWRWLEKTGAVGK